MDDQIGSRPSAWSKRNSTGTHVLSGRAGEKRTKKQHVYHVFSDVVWGFLGGGVDLNQQKFATKRRNNRGSTVRPRMEEEHITLHKDSRLKPQTLSFFQIM